LAVRNRLLKSYCRADGCSDVASPLWASALVISLANC